MPPSAERRAATLLRIAAIVPLSLFLASCSRDTPIKTSPDNAERQAGRQRADLFRDMTASSGLHFQFRNGEDANRFAILESLGGGVALLDYDRDGLLDIFVTGGGHFGPGEQIVGHPNRLYRNEGNWRFRDVTAEAGLPVAGSLFYSCGCAAGDFDGDGWPDLLVTGYGRMALYRNNRGKFEDVTERAGLRASEPVSAPVHWSTGCAWGDVNGDGRPDLLVVHYVDWSLRNNPACQGDDKRQDVCPPSRFQPLPHRLYMNNGDGTFRDASREAGLKPGAGLGVLLVDVDDDGRPDIYIANDGGGNFLYLNRGRHPWDEVGLPSGTSCDETGQPGGSMGVDAAAYDGSDRFSIFVTNFFGQTHFLFRNLGRATFQNVSRAAGITAIGMKYVGFGTSFVDFDNDGMEDMVISNGHVLRFPNPPQTPPQKPVLLRNARRWSDEPGACRFEDVTAHGGPYFRAPHRGRGLAAGDLDNDGNVDVVISHCNEPVALLRNQADNRNHWLGVHLTGLHNREVVGAKITLEADGKKLVRAIKGGGSYLSSSDRRVVFGLGGVTKVTRLNVRWPWGKSQSWNGPLDVDRYWLLEEGKAEPTPLHGKPQKGAR
jgi:hypothetical protein